MQIDARSAVIEVLNLKKWGLRFPVFLIKNKKDAEKARQFLLFLSAKELATTLSKGENNESSN